MGSYGFIDVRFLRPLWREVTRWADTEIDDAG